MTFLFKMSYNLLFSCIIFVVSLSSSLPTPSSLNIDGLSQTAANISWTTPSNSTFCDFNYVEEGGERIVTEKVPPVHDSLRKYEFELGGLEENTLYEVTVVCYYGKTTILQSHMNFTTLSNSTTTSRTTSSQPITTEQPSITPTTWDAITTVTVIPATPPAPGSTLDIILGSLSALVGVVIIAIVGFYAWRKYQRRRRIRRFFRHHQLAQPFPGDAEGEVM